MDNNEIFNKENKNLLKKTILTMVKSGKPKQEIMEDFTELFVKTGLIYADEDLLRVDLNKLEIRPLTNEETVEDIVDKLLGKVNKDSAPRHKNNSKIFTYKVPDSYKNLPKTEATQKIKSDLLKCMQTAGWSEEEINKPMKDLPFKDELQIMISQTAPNKNSIDGFTEYFYQKSKNKSSNLQNYKNRKDEQSNNNKVNIDTIKTLLNKYRIFSQLEFERFLLFFEKLEMFIKKAPEPCNRGAHKPHIHKQDEQEQHAEHDVHEEHNEQKKESCEECEQHEEHKEVCPIEKIIDDPAFNGHMPIDRNTGKQIARNGD